MAAQFECWDVPAEVQDEMLAAAQPPTFGVYPANWETLQLFLAVSSQWRLGPNGAPTGLDYSAVDVAIRHLDLKVNKDSFRGLQIMESAATAEMIKRQQSRV